MNKYRKNVMFMVDDFFRQDDSAETVFSRLFTVIRQIYYLHRDAEQGVPVDYETLESYTNSLLYLGMKEEKLIKGLVPHKKTESLPMETRGGVMENYEKLLEGMNKFYDGVRREANERIKANKNGEEKRGRRDTVQGV